MQIGHEPVDAAGIFVVVEEVGFLAHHLADDLCQLVDRGLLPAADVDGLTVDVGGGSGGQGFHHIVDVDKIAALATVTVDDDGGVLIHLAHHVGDDRGMGGRQRLSWAVGVKDAQGDRLEADQLPHGEKIVLCRHFAHRIGDSRLDRHLFADRLRRLPPVDSGAASEDNAADAHIAAGFKQGNGAADVDVVVFAWVENRGRHTDTRRQVIDHIHAVKQGPDVGHIAHIAPFDEDIGR